MKSTEKKNSAPLTETERLRCVIKILENDVKEAREGGVKKFAHFLIDQARDGVIHISDLPDYVCKFLREKENDDTCDC